jgi:hypothetical protein
MTLPEIIARLEASTGPDRKLDELIARHFGWTYEFDEEELSECWRNPEGFACYVPRLTGSVDAALSLAERLLPGCRWTIDNTGPVTASIWHFEDDAWRAGEETYQVEGNTPPLALVIATLRALSAQQSIVNGEGRE